MLTQRERNRFAVGLSVLALLGAAGAVLTYTRPETVAEILLPEGIDPELVKSFILPDLVVYAVFPAVAAFGEWKGREWTGRVLWMAAGASLYAFLWIMGAGAVAGVTFTAAVVGLLPFFYLLFAATRWLVGRLVVDAVDA